MQGIAGSEALQVKLGALPLTRPSAEGSGQDWAHRACRCRLERLRTGRGPRSEEGPVPFRAEVLRSAANGSCRAAPASGAAAARLAPATSERSGEALVEASS